MLVSEVGRGVAIAAVAVTVGIGKPSVPLLTAAAVVEGILEVFSALAERRWVGSLVRRDEVPSALVQHRGQEPCGTPGRAAARWPAIRDRANPAVPRRRGVVCLFGDRSGQAQAVVAD